MNSPANDTAVYLCKTKSPYLLTVNAKQSVRQKHNTFPPVLPKPGLQLTGTLLTIQKSLNYIITSRFVFNFAFGSALAIHNQRKCIS